MLGMKDVDRSTVLFIFWSNDMFGTLCGSLLERQTFGAIQSSGTGHLAKTGLAKSPQPAKRVKRENTPVHFGLVS